MKRGLDRLDARVRRAGSTGPDRLTQVILGFFAAAGHGSPERAFVDREPALAMRVMTAGPVHDRLIAWFTAAIEQEANAGTVVPLHPPAQIADIVVRSGEAVFWFDRASGRGIDRDNLVVILSALCPATTPKRSEEHTSELQSLMRISYAVFCLNKQKTTETTKLNT